MKIIGKASSETYLCEVEHTELEKFLGLYYGKLNRLDVGREVDLGKGYDHASEIARAMRATQELIEKNQVVVTAILNGLSIQAILQAAPESADTQKATA